MPRVKPFIFALATLLGAQAFADVKCSTMERVPYSTNPAPSVTLFGYKTTGGAIVVEAEYEQVDTEFCSGWARVKKDGAWGYINYTGKSKIEAKYIDARPFAEEYAAVEVPEGWTFIDRKGVEQTAEKFLRVGLINPQGYVEVSTLEDGNETGKWNVLATKAQFAKVFAVDHEDVNFFSNDIFGLKDNGKWTIVRKDGSVYSDGTYESLKSSKTGKFAITQNGDRYGIINLETGKRIQPVFHEVREMWNMPGLFVGRIGSYGGLYGADLESNGWTLDMLRNSAPALAITQFSENFGIFPSINGGLAIADSTGKVLSSGYQYACPVQNGLAAIRDTSNSLVRFITPEGVEKIPALFSDTTSFHEGEARVIQVWKEWSNIGDKYYSIAGWKFWAQERIIGPAGDTIRIINNWVYATELPQYFPEYNPDKRLLSSAPRLKDSCFQ